MPRGAAGQAGGEGQGTRPFLGGCREQGIAARPLALHQLSFSSPL